MTKAKSVKPTANEERPKARRQRPIRVAQKTSKGSAVDVVSESLGIREKGGVSQSLSYVRSCLKRELQGPFLPPSDAIKEAALAEIGDLLRIAFQQALNGGQECGYFFGELIPALQKKRKSLDNANTTFRERAAQIERARPKTIRSGPLRQEIYDIIEAARSSLRTYRWAKATGIPEETLMSLGYKPDERILALPDLTAESSAEDIEKWTDVVVYRQLKQLTHRPLIGAMKKALDKTGKVQPSRLRSQIRDTVARIAAQPRTSYVDL